MTKLLERYICHRLFLLLFLLAWGVVGCDSDRPRIELNKGNQTETPLTAKKIEEPIRIAVGAMITPKDGFVYYRDFLAYIEGKLQRPVKYVDKESYAEINNMLKNNELDVAFVCSGPYVDGGADFGLQPLVAPQAYGESVYYSYIIVPFDSPIKSFLDLRGKKFAFTDPQSNSGTLVPTYMLAKITETPDSFFSEYEYTHAHDKSIKAVALKLVDGAAVDSLIWEYSSSRNPQYTSKTKVIVKSPPYGIPPVVVRPGLDPDLIADIKDIFLHAHEDEQGRELLAGMMIEKFSELDDHKYDSVREMKLWLKTQKDR